MSQSYTLQSTGGDFATDTFTGTGGTTLGGTLVVSGETLVIPAGSGDVTTSSATTLTVSGAIDLSGALTTLTINGGLTGGGTIGIGDGATLVGPGGVSLAFDSSGGTYVETGDNTIASQMVLQQYETYVLAAGATLQTTGNTSGLTTGPAAAIYDGQVVIDGDLNGTNGGVVFFGGGTVSVGTTGTVSTGFAGIVNRANSADAIVVDNAGTIDGDTSMATSTSLASYAAIALDQPTPPYPGTALVVDNSGLIEDETEQAITVRASAASTITNEAGAVFLTKAAGLDGIDIYNGTVTNYGTITPGAAGNAVVFAGTGDEFIIGGGSTIGGDVVGFGPSLNNTLGLAGTGTLGTTSQYIDFATLAVAAGANWTIDPSSTMAGITSIVDFGTLTQTGSGTNNLFIDQGGVDLITGSGGLSSLTVGFGTLGTELAPNVLDFTNTAATYFGGSVYGFGPNDQIGIGEFSGMPTDISITTGGTAGTIGLVEITGSVGGSLESFALFGVTLAPGVTLGQELVGQQIYGATGLELTQTKNFGVVLQIGEPTVTLTNAEPYTLAAGRVLDVGGGGYDIVNTGNYTTLFTDGTIISDNATADIAFNGTASRVYNGSSGSTAALIEGGGVGVMLSGGSLGALVENFGTITDSGYSSGDTGVRLGSDYQNEVVNFGYIGGSVGTGINMYDPITIGDVILNAGTIAGQVGEYTVTEGFFGPGSASLINVGLITHGVYIGASGALGGVLNAGTIGTVGGVGSAADMAIYDRAVGLLDLQAGQSLSDGTVMFGAGSTIDLSANGSAALVGTLVNPGSYYGFTSLTIANGADWEIGNTAAVSSVTGVADFIDLGTLAIGGSLGGTSIDMEGSLSTAASVVDFTGAEHSTELYDFGGDDQIILGGTLLPAAGPGSGFTNSYDSSTGMLVVSEIDAEGNVAGTQTVNVFGTSPLNSGSFVEVAGPNGVTILLGSGTLTGAMGDINIDYGEQVTLANAAGADTIPVNFGTHGTEMAPNVLDLSSPADTVYAGPINGFGPNDQIEIGEFTSLPSDISITAGGTVGDIGAVTITGTVEGTLETFVLEGVTLAPGVTLGQELIGQQIYGVSQLGLVPTADGVALEYGEQTVTLANATPYTLGVGQTLNVPDGFYDVTNTGGNATLVNLGTIISAYAFADVALDGPANYVVNGSVDDPGAMISGGLFGVSLNGEGTLSSAVQNFGTITDSGDNPFSAGVYAGNSNDNSVFNAGYIGGTVGAGIDMYSPVGGADVVFNTGTIAGGDGEYTITEGESGAGNSSLINTGLINHGVYLGGRGAASVVYNAGTIGVVGGDYGNTAIYNYGTGVLELAAGQSLSDGTVQFGDGSTIELGGGPAVGTLVNPGSYYGFAALTILAGADWQIGNAANAVSVAGVASFDDFGTLQIAGSLDGTSVDMEGGATGAASVVDFTGSDLSTPLTDFGGDDEIVLGGTLLPAAGPGGSFVDNYDPETGMLTVAEVGTDGDVVGVVTLDVTGSNDLDSSSFVEVSGPGGVSILLGSGTLTGALGGGAGSINIDYGEQVTLANGDGADTIPINFGTHGTEIAPNVLNLSSPAETLYAGPINGFGPNDQIDIGEFTALPDDLTISAAGITGDIGAVTITGSIDGTLESFVFDGVTLAPGVTLSPNIVGQQIYGTDQLGLVSTNYGFALTVDEQTVTLSNAAPYTLGVGQTLDVGVAGAYDVTNTGGPTTLVNMGTILSQDAPADIVLLGPDLEFVNDPGALVAGGFNGIVLSGPAASEVDNFGTITDTGYNNSSTAVYADNTDGNFVYNGGYIGGSVGSAIGMFNTVGTVGDGVVNFGTLAGQDGDYTVTEGRGGAGSSSLVNGGLIEHGVYLGGGGTSHNVVNLGTIGVADGDYGNVAIYNRGTGALYLAPGQSLSDGTVQFGEGSSLYLGVFEGGVGTLVNPGSYYGFTSLTIIAGADWQIGNAASAVSVAGVASFDDFGTLQIAGSLGGTSIDMEGSIATSSSVVEFTGNDVSTPLYDFGANDAIVLGGSLLPAAEPGGSFTDSYDSETGALTVNEIGADGSVTGTVTVDVTGTAPLDSASFVEVSGPGGVSILLGSGTLTGSLGGGAGSINIDYGEHVTLANGDGADTIPINFGTHGTGLAPNVLDLSSPAGTLYAGPINGFGPNDQIDIGEFTALPTDVLITADGTMGDVGAVTITGTVGGMLETFVLDGVTLAPGVTLGQALVGQQIYGATTFGLVQTNYGIALEVGEQTVTLAGANAYTVGVGVTLAVMNGDVDITNIYNTPAFLNNLGTILSAAAPSDIEFDGPQPEFVNGSQGDNTALVAGGYTGVVLIGQGSVGSELTNFGTITDDGSGSDAAGVYSGSNAGNFVYNGGYIGGAAGVAIEMYNSVGAAGDLVVNFGTLAGQAGKYTVTEGLGGAGNSSLINGGLIEHGVYLGGGGTAANVANLGTIGVAGGEYGNVAIYNRGTGGLYLGPTQSMGGGIVQFGEGSSLYLGGYTGGAIGTLVNPGSYFGFTSLTIGNGADWQIGNAASAVSVAGVASFDDFGTLQIAGALGGSSIDMEGSIATSSSVVDFTGADVSTPLYDFGADDAIVLGGSLLPAAEPGGSFTDSYDSETGALTINEIGADGSVTGTVTVDVTGTAPLDSASFVEVSGPGGVSILLGSGMISAGEGTDAGSISIDYGQQVTLANTAGVDTIPVSFGTHGTSLGLNLLDIDGTAAPSPYTGAISGFGLNDDIVIGTNVLPSLATGAQVTLSYVGSLLTVTELDSGGSVIGATTLDVGTSYTSDSFVALLGTNGINIETPATVDETMLTFTGTAGTIDSFEDPTLYAGGLAPGSTIVPGETVIVAAGTASISSTSPVVDNGTIIVTGTGTTLIDDAPLTGTGIVSLVSGGTFDAGGALNGGTIDMGGTGAGTMLDIAGTLLSGGTLGTPIINLGATDTIQLNGFTVTSSTYVTGVGLEISNGTITETIDLGGGSLDTSGLMVTPDAAGTEILLCYLQGTRILTAVGEVAVEDLAIGDPVVSRFGGYRPVKWIGRQSYGKRFVANNRKQIPVCIQQNALGPNQPTRDLYVSPGHSMLMGNILVLAEALVNGVSITQDDAPDDIHYYQIEFETHDCVLAEGVWSESFADGPDLRAKYHNAAEFHALYPDHVTPETINMCAARPPQGAALEAVVRSVNARITATGPRGPLCGFIDHADARRVEGWAVDMGAPDMPVLLEVLAAGRVLGTVLACGYRADLEAAGFGRGWCQFIFDWPTAVPAAARRSLTIRRAGDGFVLPMSETCEKELGVRKALRRRAG